MEDILKEFLAESGENLDHVERDLVALEETPDSRPLLASIFRNVHTIKGSSGFLGLARLEKVAHAGENLLSVLRDGRLTLNTEITTALLSLVDALRKMLTCLAQTGAECADDYSALIAELLRLQATAGTPAKATAPAQPAPKPAAPAANPPPAAAPPPAAPKTLPDDAVANRPGPEAPTSAARAEPTATAAATPPAADATAAAANSSESNVRVGVGLLDKLMNLVGELVLARNQVLQLNLGREEAALAAASQRLNLVTTELQEEVMKTRLQPIGNVWAKFPRVVRDLAHELNKRVRLEMDGKETELDRTIIEAIKDPLTHLVRNAVDHGIEVPELRRAAGKPEEGLLSVHAYHEGGQVNIEIRDDGKGINVARVKAKAVEQGLLNADQAARLTEREALHLIFHPGLSTAEKVTNVSGRGVGMDVVKTNIEKIGGAVDVQSEPGRGTAIKIKIPLTLAIIPALMVSCDGDRYAIPQVGLVELLRLEPDQARKGIETILDAPVYRLRGQLLPLVRLSEVLGIAGNASAGDGAVNIVVVQADGQQFGLIVDRVNDTQEIVVKPLGKHLKGLAVFAGATILGDGKVALILDVLGLAQRARVFARSREQKQTAAQAGGAQTAGGEQRRLLLFDIGEANRLAIDLATVGRLEKFPRSIVERAGGREVVQYRDHIINLLRLSECVGAGGMAAEEGDTLHVVVYSESGRTVALVVGHILDIVEERVRLQADGARAGVMGRAVIQGRVTELLDVPGIVRQFDPAFAQAN